MQGVSMWLHWPIWGLLTTSASQKKCQRWKPTSKLGLLLQKTLFKNACFRWTSYWEDTIMFTRKGRYEWRLYCVSHFPCWNEKKVTIFLLFNTIVVFNNIMFFFTSLSGQRNSHSEERDRLPPIFSGHSRLPGGDYFLQTSILFFSSGLFQFLTLTKNSYFFLIKHPQLLRGCKWHNK